MNVDLCLCPKCGEKFEVDPSIEVFHDGDEIEAKCDYCEAVLWLTPRVHVTFVVNDG